MRRTRLTIAAAVLGLACGCGSPAPVTLARTPSVPTVNPAGVTERPEVAGDGTEVNCRQSHRPTDAPEGSALARIRERGLLRVGGQQTYYLLSYRDAITGEMSGFEVDLARHIARAIFGDPNRIQFVAIATADREKAVQTDTVDIVLASMTMSCARANNVAFSAEYLTARQRVLVNRRSGADSLDDLGGHKVCASAGSTNIAQLEHSPSQPVPVAATNATDCLILLQQGQVDAVSTSDAILAGLAAQDRNTHVVGPPLTQAPIGAAMRLDATDLVRLVNGVLEGLRANGEWDRMYNFWLRPSLGEGRAPEPEYRD